MAEGIQAFLSDIYPLFYRMNITYVDVGAYDGSVLKDILAAGVSVGEAHLIEPNPKSFDLLTRNIAELQNDRSVQTYNIALSDRVETLSFKAARKMTQALTGQPPHTEGSGVFPVEATTIDNLAHLFREGRISLLKIDVEGFEEKVLIGAERLLSKQKIDVLYIEAGLDPEGQQQCYYRKIDDIMLRHGYRLFKVYEQMNEWLEDSPALRRMNMAYLSADFVRKRPLKLVRDTIKFREQNQNLKAQIELQNSEAAEHKKALHSLKQELADALNERGALRVASESAQSDIRQLKSDLQSAAFEHRRLGRDAKRHLDSATQLRARLAAKEEASAAETSRMNAELTEAHAALSLLQAERAELKRLSTELVEQNQRETEDLQQRLRSLSEVLAVSEAAGAEEARRLEADLGQRQQAIVALTETIDRLRIEIETLRAEILGLQTSSEKLVATQELRVAALNATLAALREELEDRVFELTAELESVHEALRDNGQLVLDLRSSLSERDRTIRLLVEENLKLSGEVRSKTPRSPKGNQSALGAITERAVGLFQNIRRPRRSDLQSLGAEKTDESSYGATSSSSKQIAEPNPSNGNVIRSTKGAGNGVLDASKTVKSETRKSVASLNRAERSEGGAQAKALEEKLWGGFSTSALRDLERLARSNDTAARDRSAATWALGCWYAAEGDLKRAEAVLQSDELARAKPTTSRLLLEAYYLVRLGRGQEVRDRLLAELSTRPDDPNLRLAMANTFVATGDRKAPDADDASRITWINSVYFGQGLMPLARKDGAVPLCATNLKGAADSPDPDSNRAKVSVILPAYNAEKTLEHTVAGLQAQSWTNIEIVIVDDCSADNTRLIMERLAQSDSRIRLLHQSVNQGSYSARNRGLDVVTGDLITIHDAGDWSHPQKIHRQAEHLLSDAAIIGNHSNWARCFNDLTFVGKFRRKDKLVDWNPSSFMFRRELLEFVGGWDRVRISADAEFIRRAKLCAKGRVIESIPESAPLSFGIETPTSLTKHSSTHGRTIYHGMRREYHEAAGHWHNVTPAEGLRLDRKLTAARAFPAPRPILADCATGFWCGLLVIADFSEGSQLEGIVSRIRQMVAAGDSVAIFNWRRYASDVTSPTGRELRQMAQDGLLQIVAPGETVRAPAAIIADVAVLEHQIDLFPNILVSDFILVDPGSDELRRSKAVAETIKSHLRSRSVWLPEPDAWTLARQREPAILAS